MECVGPVTVQHEAVQKRWSDVLQAECYVRHFGFSTDDAAVGAVVAAVPEKECAKERSDDFRVLFHCRTHFDLHG